MTTRRSYSLAMSLRGALCGACIALLVSISVDTILGLLGSMDLLERLTSHWAIHIAVVSAVFSVILVGSQVSGYMYNRQYFKNYGRQWTKKSQEHEE